MDGIILVALILVCIGGLFSDILYWRIKYCLYMRSRTSFIDEDGVFYAGLEWRWCWYCSGVCRSMDSDYLDDDPHDYVMEEIYAMSADSY